MTDLSLLFELELGLIKAVELGSLRLIDYFIVNQECPVNYTIQYNVSRRFFDLFISRI